MIKTIISLNKLIHKILHNSIKKMVKLLSKKRIYLEITSKLMMTNLTLSSMK